MLAQVLKPGDVVLDVGGEHRMSRRFQKLEASGWASALSGNRRDATRRANAQPLAKVAIIAPRDEPGLWHVLMARPLASRRSWWFADDFCQGYCFPETGISSGI